MRDAGADASCANPSGWREKGAQPLLEMQEDRRGKGESLVLAVGGLGCWVQAVGGSGGPQPAGREEDRGRRAISYEACWSRGYCMKTIQR